MPESLIMIHMGKSSQLLGARLPRSCAMFPGVEILSPNKFPTACCLLQMPSLASLGGIVWADVEKQSQIPAMFRVFKVVIGPAPELGGGVSPKLTVLSGEVIKCCTKWFKNSSLFNFFSDFFILYFFAT